MELPSSKTTAPSLKEEAVWALNTAKTNGILGSEDTAAIFHSFDTHRRYVAHLAESFSSHPRSLHTLAIKTNPHPAILKQVVEWGFGLEAASMEEVHLALNAGCPSNRVVFDSPVKTQREIDMCNQHEGLRGIILNVNTLEELQRVPVESPNFVVGLRINPMVDTGAPDIFHVSSNESKFGVPISERKLILEAILRFPITQLHVHSGTAMSNLDSAVGAVKSLVGLAKEANEQLRAAGIDRSIGSIDIGGGLRPETLSCDKPSRMQYYAASLEKECPDLWDDFQLVTEFGQWSYFYSGYAHSQVEYAIQRGESRIVYVHLGADFLMRDVYNKKPRGVEFVPMRQSAVLADEKEVKTDIAGPLCFAGDYLEKGLMMPRLEEGDELLLLNTGSNAFGLWSRHCSRTIPQMIGVYENEKRLVCMSPRFNPFLNMM